VAFDIDANGIVEVSAKDQATGKQQRIRITSSSGLSKDEIDRLVKDAELHADEDNRKKELVDAKNAADALIYATEKTLQEMGAKVDGSVRMEIDDAVTNLKRALKGDNAAEIRQLTEVLTRASHKLAESMYRQQADSQGSGPHTNPNGNTNARAKANGDDDVVDADYEEVA
jgi:molecular chaperone DnaK